MPDVAWPDESFLRPASHVAINVFLALIPALLAVGIARGARAEERRTGRVRWLVWLPALLLWLLFLPNAPYLLTEWRHYLETIVDGPLYVQARIARANILTLLLVTAFYILYSGAGLWLFFLSLWPLDRLTRARLGIVRRPLHALIFFLCALGVYLGLVNRFNSKDVIHLDALRAILATALGTFAHPTLMGLIVAFAAVLWFLYWLFGIWMDGALWRVRRRREYP